MNMKAPAVYRLLVWGGAWAIFLASGLAAAGQNVVHLPVTCPGGMPGAAVITGIDRVTNGVHIRWYGPPGYYQVAKGGCAAAIRWRAGLRRVPHGHA